MTFGRAVQLLTVGVFVFTCARPQPELREDDLAYYTRMLSSPAFNGRESGTLDAYRAARTIAREHKRNQLQPLYSGSFMDRFSIELGSEADGENLLTVTLDSEQKTFPITPVPSAVRSELTGELLYASFCLRSATGSELHGLPVRGRVLLCSRYAPGGKENQKFQREMSFQAKLQAAREAGATGLIFLRGADGPVMKTEDFEADLRGNFPAAFVNGSELYDLLPWLRTAEQDLLAGKPVKEHGRIVGSATLKTAVKEKKRPGFNVGAVPYPHEHGRPRVLVGAHLDHIGRGDFSSMGKRGRIHPGADDNASGTAVLLELGAYLQKNPVAGLNVEIVHFDGEERGLLGAEIHATRNEKNLPDYMINLDMVGRLRKERGLHLQGADSGDERWRDLLLEAHSRSSLGQLKLDFMPGGRGPSDHSVFYMRNVPVAFLFTGEHSEYHTERDTFDTLNLEGLLGVTEFTLEILHGIASLSPPVNFRRAPEEPLRAAFSWKLRLGIMPGNYTGNDGILVGAIRKEAPIANSGLKEGDVIQKIGSESILTMRDLMRFLDQASAEKEYEFTIRRKEEVLTVRSRLWSGR
ncbi:MAG: M28 family peptidase [Spirochaetales bacterium]|nr:M28 family peptidase [Spirochaetales bacterium]